MFKIIICGKEYTTNTTNLLDTLIDIQKKYKTLGFRFNCKSGVCGSCAVRVNGVEKLACSYNIKDKDIIEPLNNLPIIKDLIIDDANIKDKLLQAKASLNSFNDNQIKASDIDIIDIESNCILCNSCYSSCPVYEVNTDFLGPFALARTYRYIHDKKELNTLDKLDAIQKDGIWDCTLCGACDLVCPQNIPIKDNIMKLQNRSIQAGYENPTFSSSDEFDSFSSDNFSGGFNPNGF